MPDTGPITDSFPWLAVRYRPVWDNRNTIGADVFYVAENLDFLLVENGDNLITESSSSASPGDLYRWI